jgi:hypothetical protein
VDEAMEDEHDCRNDDQGFGHGLAILPLPLTVFSPA